MVQPMWCGLCGVDFVVRATKCNIYGERLLVRTMWCNLIGPIDLKILNLSFFTDRANMSHQPARKLVGKTHETTTALIQ